MSLKIPGIFHLIFSYFSGSGYLAESGAAVKGALLYILNPHTRMHGRSLAYGSKTQWFFDFIMMWQQYTFSWNQLLIFDFSPCWLTCGMIHVAMLGRASEPKAPVSHAVGRVRRVNNQCCRGVKCPQYFYIVFYPIKCTKCPPVTLLLVRRGGRRSLRRRNSR